MKLKYFRQAVLEFANLATKCRDCFFFSSFRFLTLVQIQPKLIDITRSSFLCRSLLYRSFFSEYDSTRFDNWNRRKQKQVNDLRCKITNLFIWKNTWKENDLAVIGRPFSSIQCIWWDHFLLSQMSLGQKYRLVWHWQAFSWQAFIGLRGSNGEFKCFKEAHEQIWLPTLWNVFYSRTETCSQYAVAHNSCKGF